MGLKCRLLGHSYGKPEVERDREEQGDEVVVTIREVQVCERCGDEQIVSQNKEVTAIRSPEDVGLQEGADAEGGATAEPDRSTESGTGDADATGQPTVAPAESTPAPADAEEASADATEPEPGPESEPETVTADQPTETAEGAGVIDEAETGAESGAGDGWETGSDDWEDVDADDDVDDAVILDDAESERDETQWPEETDTDPQRAAQESAAREAGGAEPTPDEEMTNDAEIIDGDGTGADAGRGPDADAGAGSAEGASGRGHGEWVEHDAGDAANGWPDHDGEDEGYAATPGGDADVEFESGGGLTPEVNGHAEPESDAETVEGIAAEPDTAGTRAESASSARGAEAAAEADEGFARAGESTTLEADVPDDRVEFYCPNCGHARLAGASSMRAGDICPECKQGYIAERER